MNHDELRRAVLAADAEREGRMNTNEPGREPEPTDAVNELAKMNNVNAWAKGQLRILAEMAEDRGLDFFCRDAKRIADGITVLDRIPGARPMPDTPAPDEVAQLQFDLQCAATDAHALTARIADLEREVADRNSDYINDSATLAEISAENTAIRAKCSDLERENAALGEEVNNARRLAGEGGAA